MNENVIALAKINRNVFSTNPNDFVFRSDLNCFKIIKEATHNITLAASTNNQSFQTPHGVDFIPLIDAYAKRSLLSSQVFKPNGYDVETWTAISGMSGDIKFNYASADNTNIIFNFDNAKVVTVDIAIRYFVLEGVE